MSVQRGATYPPSKAPDAEALGEVVSAMTGAGWVSAATIARTTGYGRATVLMAFHALADAGEAEAQGARSGRRWRLT